jgi:hypothetical protein
MLCAEARLTLVSNAAVVTRNLLLFILMIQIPPHLLACFHLDRSWKVEPHWQARARLEQLGEDAIVPTIDRIVQIRG